MRIGWLSDLDFRASGYFNISIALCSGLIERGHEVKVIGFGYKGEEHNYPFGIIPSNNLMECSAIVKNLENLWKMDVLIVALDIPIQEQFLSFLQNRKFKYFGVFPIEAPPLCLSWSMVLMSMDKQLVISRFGTEEAHRMGIPAIYLPVGIDTKSWRPSTSEERKKIRTNGLGIDDDTFVILTVADNQERKNLSAILEVYSEFVQDHPKSLYILVTREHNLAGWKLQDYMMELDANPTHKVSINDKRMIIERGISFTELWSLYAASDAFVMASKAEGMNLPLLEAMATGIPAIGTNCTGIAESLADGRGYLVEPEYYHRDPFGNGMRYWINKNGLLEALNKIYDKQLPDTKAALEYAQGMTWEKSIDILCEQLKEFEKKDEQK